MCITSNTMTIVFYVCIQIGYIKSKERVNSIPILANDYSTNYVYTTFLLPTLPSVQIYRQIVKVVVIQTRSQQQLVTTCEVNMTTGSCGADAGEPW